MLAKAKDGIEIIDTFEDILTTFDIADDGTFVNIRGNATWKIKASIMGKLKGSYPNLYNAIESVTIYERELPVPHNGIAVFYKQATGLTFHISAITDNRLVTLMIGKINTEDRTIAGKITNAISEILEV
jgi:hypothetical protein